VEKFAKPGNGNRPIVTRRQFLILKNFHLITLSQAEADRLDVTKEKEKVSAKRRRKKPAT
jgi:hypothetical protein